MYFQAIEHGMSLVVELQIVHEKLLVVRENWSAHDAYEHSRFLAEIFHVRDSIISPAVPWARLECPDPEAKRWLDQELSSGKSVKAKEKSESEQSQRSDRVRTFSM